MLLAAGPCVLAASLAAHHRLSSPQRQQPQTKGPPPRPTACPQRRQCQTPCRATIPECLESATLLRAHFRRSFPRRSASAYLDMCTCSFAPSMASEGWACRVLLQQHNISSAFHYYSIMGQKPRHLCNRKKTVVSYRLSVFLPL
jgi:hypothetical protein